MLDDPEARSLFRKLLNKEMSVENLNYYDAVDAMPLAADSKAYVHAARRLWKHFVAPDAEECVNLPSHLQAAFKSAVVSAGRPEPAKIAETLDRTQAEIFVLMARDPFKRFLRSQDGKQSAERLKLLQTTQTLHRYVEIKDRSRFLRRVRECFVGSEAVTAVCGKHGCQTRIEALDRLNRLYKRKLVVEAGGGARGRFEDSNRLYRFASSALVGGSRREGKRSATSKVNMYQAVYVLRERQRLLGHQYVKGGVHRSAPLTCMARAVDASGQSLLLTGGAGGGSKSKFNVVKIWNMESGQHTGLLRGAHKKRITGVCGLTSLQVATSSYDGSVCLWDIPKPVTRAHARAHSKLDVVAAPRATLQGHDGWVLSICGVSRGRLVASGGTDATVRVWKTVTRAQGSPQLHELKGHRAAVTSLAAVTESVILSGSSDSTIRLWNVDEGKELGILQRPKSKVFEGLTSMAKISTSHVVTGGIRGSVCLWDVEEETFLAQVGSHVEQGPKHTHHRAPCRGVARLNESLAASVGDDRKVRVWDVRSSEMVREFMPSKYRHRSGPGGAVGSEEHKIRAVSSFPEDCKLVVGEMNGSCIVFGL